MTSPTIRRSPSPFPERNEAYGPATRRRLRRTMLIVSVVWFAALVPFLLDASSRWKAFGLGLALPGFGFGYAGGWAGPIMFLVATALLGISFVLWFGSGNIVAPAVVWLGGAAGAAAMTTEPPRGWWPWVVLAAIVAIVGRVSIRTRRAFLQGKRNVAANNEALARIELPEGPAFGRDPVAVAPELSAEDLAFHRHFLELALQPRESFEGYTVLDQFQFAALRYQISWIQYALAMAQYTRTPAFHGYVARAQRNLIEKVTMRKVWSYWALENAWGNFRFDPNPIARDNIMLSGYLSLQLGMYESIVGDLRYHTPGALSFDWSSRRSYRYDTNSVNTAVGDNFRRSPFGMFPCEPNWLFPICNVVAIDGLAMYHRMYGYDGWDEILDHYRHAVDVEFVRPDGSPVGIRSQRFGFEIRIPFPMDGRARSARLLGGDSAKVLGPGPYSPLLAAVLPDVVERSLSLGSLRRLGNAVAAGKLPMTQLGSYDVGNYQNTGAGAHPWLTMVAREYGDDPFYEAIRQSADAVLDPVTRNGVRTYDKLSTLAAAQMFTGRFSRKDGFFDLVNRGNLPEWNTGPILDEAPYPQVLVARAVTDGAALHLVLRRGDPAVRRVRLSLKRLVAGRRYVVDHLHTDFTANPDGRADIEIDLPDRVELTIRPLP